MKIMKKNVNGKNFESLKELLRDAILREGFSILSEYDFGKILASKGMKCNGNAYVINMCNPSIAEKILNSNVTFGIHLPCKVGIFEGKNGYTLIYPEPTSTIESEDPIVQSSLNKINEALRKISESFE